MVNGQWSMVNGKQDGTIRFCALTIGY